MNLGVNLGLFDYFTKNTQTTQNTHQEVVGGNADSLPQLTYDECKEIYARFSLGKRFVKSIVRFAMKSNRVISIADAPDDVAKEYENYFLKHRYNQIIKNAIYLSRVYGVSGIYVGVEGDDDNAEVGFTAEAKKNTRVYFKTLDPLNFRYTVSQDPTSSTFLEPSNIEIFGKKIHKTRFLSVLNGDPIYLFYSASSFNFGGLSIFANMQRFIEIWASLYESLEKLANKASAIIVENESNGIQSAKDAEVARHSAQLLKEMRSGGVAWLNDGQHANFFNLSGATEIASMIESVKEALAIALDDTPTAILFDDKLSSGLNEGGADLEKMTMLIDSFREDVIRPIYNFFDNIIPYKAWSDDFIIAIKAKHGDKYGHLGVDEIRELWMRNLTYTYADTNAKTKLQTEEAKKIQLENLKSLKELGASQSTLQELINASGIFELPIELEEPMEKEVWGFDEQE